jgi:hypothetical protein
MVHTHGIGVGALALDRSINRAGRP